MADSVGQIVAQIVGRGVPVIFLDTCAVLDIHRLIARSDDLNQFDGELRAIARIADASSSTPPRCRVILPYPVAMEITDNQASALQDANKAINATAVALAHFGAAANILGAGAPATTPSASLVQIQKEVSKLADQILCAASDCAHDEECMRRGNDRVATKTAPSKNGKEAKDCWLTEHVLEVTRQSRDLGFQGNVVLLSSNKKDFYDSRGAPASPLDTEFGPLGIDLRRNWRAAAHALGL